MFKCKNKAAFKMKIDWLLVFVRKYINTYLSRMNVKREH